MFKKEKNYSKDTKKYGGSLYFFFRTDSVRCPAPGRTSQAIWRWVSTWMGDRRSAACISKRWAREVIFSETVDWGQTLWNGWLYRHRFSAVFLCFRANAIQHRREWRRSHSQGGTSGGKTVKERGNGKKGGKGKRGWGYVKGNSRTGGTTNKKNTFSPVLFP